MTVKIGHASIDEKGKIAGGQAGDQTKKELCVREYYNMKHNIVLRPKKATLAEKAAKACEEACANDNIGYDQNQRNTLRTEAEKVKYKLSKIKTKCETDCSALQTVCAIAGGANIKYGTNGPTTSTMRKVFKDSGDYEVLTAKKYLTNSDYLLRGDVLVKEGSHTVIVLSDGAKVKKVEEVVSKFYDKYVGTSCEIDTVFKAIGVPKAYRGEPANRKPVAKKNGILTYKGTESQNIKLINLAKKGKLKKV